MTAVDDTLAGAEVVRVPNPDTGSTGESVDVVDLAAEVEDGERSYVIDNFQRPQQIIVVAGEEGGGKTTLSDQAMRQMIRREPVWGFEHFTPGAHAPERILFYDTHQERTDEQELAQSMTERGLPVDRDRYRWLPASGERLHIEGPSRERLEREIERRGIDYIWFDSAAHVVEDPNADLEVRSLFEYLRQIMSTYAMVGMGMTLFPRKRAQGTYERRFDDLFGSREWKGQPQKQFYIEGTKITCWKDRGRDLFRVWHGRAGGGQYATATLSRPGLSDDTSAPFIITSEPPEPDHAAATEARAYSLVEDNPLIYSKSSLAMAVGKNRVMALTVIEQMLTEGRIGPNQKGARLHVGIEGQAKIGE